MSIGEAAQPRVFCYVDVAVSIGEGSCKTSCLLLRGCRRVYRRSCKTSCLLLRGCLSIGEAAKPRVFCCVDVAVSIGEVATLRVFCSVDVAVSIGEAAKPGKLQNLVSFATWLSPCL